MSQPPGFPSSTARSSPSLGGPVRFTATLTEALPWTVTVRARCGPAPRERDRGDSGGLDLGRFRDAVRRLHVRDRGGPDLRPARGTVPGPAAARGDEPDRQPAHADAERRRARRVDLRVVLAFHRASVAVEVLDSSSQVVRTLASSFSYSGRASFAWNGRNASGHPRSRRPLSHPDHGHVAGPAGAQEPRHRGRPDPGPPREVAPTPFSPNGDGRLDSTAIGFRLARDADVRVRIMDGTTDGGRRPPRSGRFGRAPRRSRGRTQPERCGRGRGLPRRSSRRRRASGRVLSRSARDRHARSRRPHRLGSPSEGRAHGRAPLAERGGDGPASLRLAGAGAACARSSARRATSPSRSRGRRASGLRPEVARRTSAPRDGQARAG